jgi:hypothetical protein
VSFLYTARIAPCANDWREALRDGLEVVDGGVWRESFAPTAFLKTDKPVPVVLSHDEGRQVGHVTQRITHAGWHLAVFVIDHSRTLSSDRLKVGTPVSIGFTRLSHDQLPLLRDARVMRHTTAVLNELSILKANEVPAFVGAMITQAFELPAKRTAAARDVEIPATGQPIRRYGVGQVLAVR